MRLMAGVRGQPLHDLHIRRLIAGTEQPTAKTIMFNEMRS